MKKFVCFVSIVVLTVVALFVANDIINSRMLSVGGLDDENEAMARNVQHVFSGVKVDEVPILGSSRVWGYLDGKISPHCHSCSVSGSKMRETLLHLKKVLVQREKGLVIVNLDPWGATDCYLNFTGVYDLVLDDPDVKKMVPNQGGGFPFLRSVIKYPFRFKHNFQRWQRRRREVAQAALVVQPQKSVLAEKNEKKTNRDEEIRKQNATVKPWSFLQLREVDSFVQEILATQRDNVVLWVVAPMGPYKRSLMKNPQDLKDYLHWLAEHKNNYVIDLFSRDIGFTEYDFEDPNHLANDGKVKFSAMLKAEMEKIPVVAAFM